MQMVMSSPLAGAEITTFLAPAVRCFDALSLSVKRPVLSSTNSTPRSFQGSFSGSLIAETLIDLPFTTSASPLASTVPGKRLCTESYFSRWASVFVSVISLTPTNSMSVCFAIVAARNTLRPMRPNPLMPTRTAMSLPLGEVWNCGARERDTVDFSRAGFLPRRGCLGQRGTGGEDIVHEHECDVRRVACGVAMQHVERRTPHVKRSSDVRQASLRCQRRLRRRLARADEQVDEHGNPPLSGQRARQHFTLVVASLPQA